MCDDELIARDLRRLMRRWALKWREARAVGNLPVQTLALRMSVIWRQKSARVAAGGLA